MPNIFAPLGFAMGRMNKDPLMGVDAVTQTLGGYQGGRGSSDPYGGQGAAGGGLGSDPVSRSLMLQSLAEGQPATEAQRTPQEGLFKYGLSKLGILSPMVHASADQYHLEQLALQGRQQQQLKESGDIFKTAIEISKTSPEAAKAYFENYAGGQIDPRIWDDIQTKADLEQQKLATQQEIAEQKDALQWQKQQSQAAEDSKKLDVENARLGAMAAQQAAEAAHWRATDTETRTYRDAQARQAEATEHERIRNDTATRYTAVLTSPNSTDDDRARARRGLHDLGLYPDVPMPDPSAALAGGGGSGVPDWIKGARDSLFQRRPTAGPSAPVPAPW